jgi:hypothetical protein
MCLPSISTFGPLLSFRVSGAPRVSALRPSYFFIFLASRLSRASRGHSSLASAFSPNPNHSHTYKRLARKSNHSPTYAKHGGGGLFDRPYLADTLPSHSCNLLLYLYLYKQCRRADIFHIPFQSAFKRRFPLSTFYLPTLLTAFLPAPYYGYRFIQLNSHSRCCLGIRSSPDRCGLLGDEF